MQLVKHKRRQEEEETSNQITICDQGDVSLLSDCCYNARDLKSLKPSPALLPYISFNGYLSPKGMCSLD